MTTSASVLDDAVFERLEAEFLRPSDAELRLIAGLTHSGGCWDEHDEQMRITRYRTMNRGCCG